jgi:hypothetical protein
VYTETIVAECEFLNVCIATFTAVPAGRISRVTAIMGFSRFQQSAGFVALHNSDRTPSSILFATPVHIVSGNYYGALLTFNIPTDVVFTAGQSPVLELGNGSGITEAEGVRLSITGTLSPAPQ